MFIGTCSRQYSSATFYYTTTKSDEAKANAEVFFAVYTLIFFAGSLILFAFVRVLAWCEQALTDREQQRIQDFPEGTKLQGGANSQEGTNLVFGQMFRKTAWKWRKLNRRGKMNDRKVSSSESPFESRHHLILCGLWMAQYENEVPTRIRVSGHLRTLIRNIVHFRLKVRRCPMLLIKVWGLQKLILELSSLNHTILYTHAWKLYDSHHFTLCLWTGKPRISQDGPK